MKMIHADRKRRIRILRTIARELGLKRTENMLSSALDTLSIGGFSLANLLLLEALEELRSESAAYEARK